MNTASSVTDWVHNYYTTVDAGDAAATAALFSDDATYHRPGYSPLHGQEIAEFYHGARVIKSGTHTLEEVIVNGLHAASRGNFKGVLKDGSEVHVGFADFFEFTPEGTIQNRVTYFFQASV